MTASVLAGIVIASLMPGAFFYWGFERLAGQYGISSRDRFLRIAGASAVFLLLYSPGLYWLFVSFGESFSEPELLPWVWILPAASAVFLAIPVAVGYAFGVVARDAVVGDHGDRRRVRRTVPMARFLGLDRRVPTAWEHMISGIVEAELRALARCRLKSGEWVAGAFSVREDNMSAHASGYPEESDLYLTPIYSVDPETGDWVRDTEGRLVQEESGVWISKDQIEAIKWTISQARDGGSHG